MSGYDSCVEAYNRLAKVSSGQQEKIEELKTFCRSLIDVNEFYANYENMDQLKQDSECIYEFTYASGKRAREIQKHEMYKKLKDGA